MVDKVTMKDYDINVLRDFLGKNNYLLTGYVDYDEKSIDVHFPKNIMIGENETQIKFRITPINDKLNEIKTISNVGELNKVFTVPSYATKLIVFYIIYTQCSYIGYDINLLSCYNKKGELINKKDVLTDVVSKLSNDDQQKESELYNLITSYMMGDEITNILDNAKKKNILSPLELLISILEEGLENVS